MFTLWSYKIGNDRTESNDDNIEIIDQPLRDIAVNSIGVTYSM